MVGQGVYIPVDPSFTRPVAGSILGSQATPQAAAAKAIGHGNDAVKACKEKAGNISEKTAGNSGMRKTANSNPQASNSAVISQGPEFRPKIIKTNVKQTAKKGDQKSSAGPGQHVRDRNIEKSKSIDKTQSEQENKKTEERKRSIVNDLGINPKNLDGLTHEQVAILYNRCQSFKDQPPPINFGPSDSPQQIRHETEVFKRSWEEHREQERKELREVINSGGIKNEFTLYSGGGPSALGRADDLSNAERSDLEKKIKEQFPALKDEYEPPAVLKSLDRIISSANPDDIQRMRSMDSAELSRFALILSSDANAVQPDGRFAIKSDQLKHKVSTHILAHRINLKPHLVEGKKIEPQTLSRLNSILDASLLATEESRSNFTSKHREEFAAMQYQLREMVEGGEGNIKRFIELYKNAKGNADQKISSVLNELFPINQNARGLSEWWAYS